VCCPDYLPLTPSCFKDWEAFLSLGYDEFSEDLVTEAHGLILDEADREAAFAIYKADYPPRVKLLGFHSYPI